MNDTDEPGKAADIDPIDRDAATIDARSDDARGQIADLVEEAEMLGRDVKDSPIPPADEPPPDSPPPTKPLPDLPDEPQPTAPQPGDPPSHP
jgi:hypothetical protein